MIQWWWLIPAVIGGGVLSWFFAKKVYDKAEQYVAKGEQTISNVVKKL